MVFQEIVISNLFSYYDRVTFDLAGHQPGRPVVLISGRNGFGKTSFLNAIKLLFTGPSDDLRNEVQAGRKLSPKLYMLGNGEEWMGVFNRRSRAERRHSHYYSRCRWEEAGGVVTVQREWFPDKEFNPTGELTIQAAFLQDSLHGMEAQQFLDKRLPPSYLSYFFFDGEKIQTIAEANRIQMQEQIEGILNIAPVNSLVEYLDRVKKSWVKDGVVGEEQRKFNQIQRDLDALNDQLSALRDQRMTREGEIATQDNRIEELERRLRSMQGLQARADEERYKMEMKQVQERLGILRQEVVNSFAPDAPMVVNPVLMQDLFSWLEQNDQELCIKQELLDYLRQHLPLQVFERPAPSKVRLRDDQEKFYRQRLTQALDEKIVHEDSGDGKNAPSIASERRKALRRLLIPLVDTNPLQSHGNRLNEVSHLARRKVELQQQLDGISTSIGEDRERYMQMEEELKGLRQQHDEHVRILDRLDGEYQRTQREMEHKQQMLNDQEAEIAKAGKNHARRQKAEELISLYKEYKAAMKKDRREALEVAINQFFKALMTSHDLIDHILVDNDFGCHFLDREGSPLGGANLSAGMKQLAAIALLWALKDVSGKSIPVIVDTPLARIDRQNQENLLQKYFPHAAEQIIVLPTDSELDRDKYRMLSPYVYREYQLKNSHGDETRVVERPMYPQ